MKKVICLLFSVALLFSLTVPALSAPLPTPKTHGTVWFNDAGFDYFSAENRLNSYAEIGTNFGASFLNEFSLSIQIINNVTGVVLAERKAYNTKLQSTLFASLGARSGSRDFASTYVACVETKDGFTDVTGKEIGMATSRSVDPDIIAQLKSERDSMMVDLGYDVDLYTYYSRDSFHNIISDKEYYKIWYQLNLVTGDTVPGFYVDNNNKSIIAVKKNSSGNIFEFTFNQSEEGNWVLI